jgi:hypothetical protein
MMRLLMTIHPSGDGNSRRILARIAKQPGVGVQDAAYPASCCIAVTLLVDGPRAAAELAEALVSGGFASEVYLKGCASASDAAVD